MIFKSFFNDQKKNSLFQFLLFFLITGSVYSQIISGPMLGYVELRTAKIWCEVHSGSMLQLKYWKTEDKKSVKLAFVSKSKFMDFETQIFDLVGLEPGTKYEYEITSKGKTKMSPVRGVLNTQELWQWRRPPPDFSILTGSCSYQNETLYDRPGQPYGNDSSIFEIMAKENSDAMFWLGDNWYTREVDYGSQWGLWYRASKDRSLPILQSLLKTMSNYGIWDDHDYGPNNSGLSYIFKEESRQVFKSYFANPSYGQNNQGIYTKVSINDVDFFLLDNRSFRSADQMNSYKDNQANPDKLMYGKEQMNWLKNSLISSNANFKIVLTGSQVLNQYTSSDCLVHYPIEYNELLKFLDDHNISGVVFLTGDKHISEINVMRRDTLYPLYDITVSPLTSGVSKLKDKERINPMRIRNSLIEEHNYGRISFLGNKKERRMVIEFVDKKGSNLFKYEIELSELRNKKKK